LLSKKTKCVLIAELIKLYKETGASLKDTSWIMSRRTKTIVIQKEGLKPKEGQRTVEKKAKSMSSYKQIIHIRNATL
jgi:capsular polysaccharide biosynthesis protein